MWASGEHEKQAKLSSLSSVLVFCPSATWTTPGAWLLVGHVAGWEQNAFKMNNFNNVECYLLCFSGWFSTPATVLNWWWCLCIAVPSINLSEKSIVAWVCWEVSMLWNPSNFANKRWLLWLMKKYNSASVTEGKRGIQISPCQKCNGNKPTYKTKLSPSTRMCSLDLTQKKSSLEIFRFVRLRSMLIFFFPYRVNVYKISIFIKCCQTFSTYIYVYMMGNIILGEYYSLSNWRTLYVLILYWLWSKTLWKKNMFK